MPGGERTDEGAAGVLAQPQHGAHSLGVGLLHQQLNDGLAVRLDQVPALSRQGGGQHGAHLLHRVDHVRLGEEPNTGVLEEDGREHL